MQPFSPHVETALHWTEPIDAGPTYHQLTWSPDCVAFESGLIGEGGGDSTVTQSWNFTNATRIPAAEGMLVHINFWLFQGKSDLNPGEKVAVALRSFAFTPAAGGDQGSPSSYSGKHMHHPNPSFHLPLRFIYPFVNLPLLLAPFMTQYSPE